MIGIPNVGLNSFINMGGMTPALLLHSRGRIIIHNIGNTIKVVLCEGLRPVAVGPRSLALELLDEVFEKTHII